MQKTPAQADENNNKWLWVDPLAEAGKLQGGGVLLAETIKRYASEFDVLVNKADFEEGKKWGAKLKGASYTMTPHPTDAWTFEKNSAGKAEEVSLKKGSDSDGEFYIVRKNSLAFIKLRQELRIPFYMIGRHNLKIRYVYKGLLLGTGPPVDPGYVGNLIIPLHNFTLEDVRIYIESSFVSIDFVRTTPLFATGESIPEDINQLYIKYEASKCLIEREKVERRRSLAKYLEGSMPQSQMGKFEYDFGQLEKRVSAELDDFENVANEVKRLQVAFQADLTRKWTAARVVKGFELAAAIGVLCLILNLYRLQERDTESRGMDLNRAAFATNLINFEYRIEKSNLANRESIDSVIGRMEKIERTISGLKSAPQNDQTNLFK